MSRPVLFIHGAFGHPRHFRSWMDRFRAAGYTCVAPALPGHDPPDAAALATLTLRDYLAALEEVRSQLPEPPILVGHSMGGLLAQQLAASAPCAALVCLASAPPGPVVPQLGAIRHLMPMAMSMLMGRPFRPTASAFRHLSAHDLPVAEQVELFESLGYESGRAYRAMVFGTADVRVGAVRCPVLCVSGAADRMISRSISAAVAARYEAEHLVLAGRGHWLIAPAGTEKAATLVLGWLARTLTASVAPVAITAR